MSTRFGGSPAYSNYAKKARWLVGALSSAALTLVVLLVLLLLHEPRPSSLQNAPQFPQQVLAAPTLSVIAASRRIEDGERIDEQMLTVIPMAVDLVPDGVVLGTQRASIVGKYAVGLINAKTIVRADQFQSEAPLSEFKIPAGFRATTIVIDSRSGVEGFAKPQSRVDVLFAFSDNRDGKRKIATLIPFAKVLSVNGVTDPRAPVTINGNTTVTLCVTEKDAKKIELARMTGTLSLALVGEMGAAGSVSPVVTEEELPGKKKADTQPAIIGSITVGKQRKLLTEKGWVWESELERMSEQHSEDELDLSRILDR